MKHGRFDTRMHGRARTTCMHAQCRLHRCRQTHAYTKAHTHEIEMQYVYPPFPEISLPPYCNLSPHLPPPLRKRYKERKKRSKHTSKDAYLEVGFVNCVAHNGILFSDISHTNSVSENIELSN